MSSDFRIGSYENDTIPTIEGSLTYEVSHFFGHPDKYLFFEADSGESEETGLYIRDFMEGEVEELEFMDRAYLRDGGTAIWNLAENEYGLEVIVNPSSGKIQEGHSPELYFEDPLTGRAEGLDVSQWYMARDAIEGQPEPVIDNVCYISNREQVR